MLTDPVCGMEVEVASEFSATYAGATRCFCSGQSKETFSHQAKVLSKDIVESVTPVRDMGPIVSD